MIVTSVHIRGGNCHQNRGTQGKCCMTEAETRVRQLQAKECQGLDVSTRNWGKQGSILPRITEGAWPCRHVGQICKISQISHIIFNNIDPYGQKTNPHSTSWLTGIIHNSVLLILTFHFWLWDLINFINFRERNSIAPCYIVIFNLKWTSTIDSIKIFCLRKSH